MKNLKKNERIDQALYYELGKIIKQARINQGYSLDDLVDKLDNWKSKSTLKRYEDGISRPDIKTLELITNALNLNLDDMIASASAQADFSNIEPYSFTTWASSIKTDEELNSFYKAIMSSDMEDKYKESQWSLAISSRYGKSDWDGSSIWDYEYLCKNTYGDHKANLEHLATKPELLEIYNDIYESENLQLLFDTARDLTPDELEAVLNVIKMIHKGE